MEWGLKPRTWDLSQMELQDTNFGVSTGSSDHNQLAGIDNENRSTSIFSVDLTLGSNNNNKGVGHDVPLMVTGNTLNQYSTSSRMATPPFSSKRGRRGDGSSHSGGQNVTCLVDGCSSELSNSREYHRRHKVCERHAKTPVVLIGGHQRRFCQQCSRFHCLEEFDEDKRSCRKRLDRHNRRRRKSFQHTELKTSHGSGATALLNSVMSWPIDISLSDHQKPPFTYSSQHDHYTHQLPPIADRSMSPYPISSYWSSSNSYDYEIGSTSHQSMIKSECVPSLLSGPPPLQGSGISFGQQYYASTMQQQQSHETGSSISSVHHQQGSSEHDGFNFP